MYAHIASKITAFAVAVVLNSLMIVGVGYMFSEQPHACAEATATVDALARLSDFVRA